MYTRCGIMNNFKLSSRLFSYSFWEGIFSYSDMGEKKKQDLFNEIDQLDKLKKKQITILVQYQKLLPGAYIVLLIILNLKI